MNLQEGWSRPRDQETVAGSVGRGLHVGVERASRAARAGEAGRLERGVLPDTTIGLRMRVWGSANAKPMFSHLVNPLEHFARGVGAAICLAWFLVKCMQAGTAHVRVGSLSGSRVVRMGW